MSVMDEIFSEYMQMRRNGLDTREALRALRTYIEPLPQTDKEALAQHLRNWEKERTITTRKTPGHDLPAVKPAAVPEVKPPAPPAVPDVPSDASGKWVECPNCKKKNRASDIFCYACGEMLDDAAAEFNTRHFADATGDLFNAEYFGLDSVLVLTERATGATFELRPQLRVTELVIGRSSDTSVMRPDVDLDAANGASLGVSRLHMAVRYEAQDNAIQVYDLGSANGSFINGQRLHPREVRLLRNLDELRLGKLVMNVKYHHPGQELPR
jgi:hypothetical protein